MRPVFKNLNENLISTTVGFAHGECLPIWQVPIKAFSQKKWNDGYAILLWEGDIFSPVSGIITEISKNGNRYRISADNGMKIMIQLGVETDNVSSEFYKIRTSVGKHVNKGENIGYIDCDGLLKKVICPISYLIFESGEEVRMLHHHMEVDQNCDTFFLCAKVEDRLL